MNVGKGTPIEFKSGAESIGFNRSAVGRSEHIELVMSEINWLRIICLKRRTGDRGRRKERQPYKCPAQTHGSTHVHPATVSLSSPNNSPTFNRFNSLPSDRRGQIGRASCRA